MAITFSRAGFASHDCVVQPAHYRRFALTCHCQTGVGEDAGPKKDMRSKAWNQTLRLNLRRLAGTPNVSASPLWQTAASVQRPQSSQEARDAFETARVITD